ncbi:hypothetical protein PSTG_19595 [Puccinia striiformis f. sp. tritici PST-78]|uniref:Uncharacterized protein n=1 Tax=Puccinia striiformis f. sp. tritici PST-78 TaxID=1165861 RepID=A0A0L0UIX2_9BASI|nr:hypothetical protein PSTG_19595 [Puccinia striiformis f. sp. tritici PST-78]
MQNRLEVCLDGNFQHRHQSKAGRNHLPVVTPRIFLKQSYVDKVSREIIDAETVDMTPEQIDVQTHTRQPMIKGMSRPGKAVTTLA